MENIKSIYYNNNEGCFESEDLQYKNIKEKFSLAEEFLTFQGFEEAEIASILGKRGYFSDRIGDLFIITVPVAGQRTLDVCVISKIPFQNGGVCEMHIKRIFAEFIESDDNDTFWGDFVCFDIQKSLKRIITK